MISLNRDQGGDDSPDLYNEGGRRGEESRPWCRHHWALLRQTWCGSLLSFSISQRTERAPYANMQIYLDKQNYFLGVCAIKSLGVTFSWGCPSFWIYWIMNSCKEIDVFLLRSESPDPSVEPMDAHWGGLGCLSCLWSPCSPKALCAKLFLIKDRMSCLLWR